MERDFLNEIHNIACELEDAGFVREANELSDVFVKIAAKKKKSTKKKNVPTNPSLWSSCKAQAKKKFDVYPSAYANAWLVREYKRRGGGYRTGNKSEFNDDFDLEKSEEMIDGYPAATQDIKINIKIKI